MKPVNCNLCSSGEYLFINRHRKDKYCNPEQEICMVVCKKCGLVYENPQLEETDLRHLYSTDYAGGRTDLPSDGEIKANELYFEATLNWIEERVSFGDGSKTVLDVGCGPGCFLSILSQRGWEAYGLEPTVHYAQFARERYGLKVITGFLEDAQFPESHFDMVILHGVLEHLRNPTQALLTIRNLLKPQGYVYIRVPNILIPIKGKAYFEAPHLYMFSPNTLALALRKCGFEPIYVENGQRVNAIAKKADLPVTIDFSAQGDDYRKIIKTVRSNYIRLFFSRKLRRGLRFLAVHILGEANKRKMMQVIRTMLHHLQKQ